MSYVGIDPRLTMLFFAAFALLVPIVLMALAVAVGVAVVRRTSPAAPVAPAAGATPLDILKMRYAKGEISKEQFDEMRRALES